jgi:hypothetical protein
MKKVYKISNSSFGVLIYATPVEKNAMFLITAPSIEHAELYQHLLDFGALENPLHSPQLYEKISIHNDGSTPIYQLKWNALQLKLLPNRDIDLKRLIILENLYSRKFQNLFLNMDKKHELIQDIQFRFSQQQLCSECQKLGINDPVLIAWFADLNQWVHPANKV